MAKYSPDDLFVWCDLETTGLGPDARILEIGVVVTTRRELKPVGRGISFVFRQANFFLEGMSDTARRMHEANGLLEEVKNSTLAPYTVERQIITYLKRQGVRQGRSPMAGNNIGWDRGYIRSYFPSLDAFCHYRCRDVSTLKGEFTDFASEELTSGIPAKRELHRSLPDVWESVEEARYYRKHTEFV